MRSAAPGWRRWSWRRPAKPRPGVKAPSMGAFHRPVRFHGRPRRRRPPSGSPSKCSARALHLHGKPPARCRRRPGRTASVWQCAACAERGTSTRPCRLASAGAALRPPPCSDHRAGSYCQETRVSVWSSSKYRRTSFISLYMSKCPVGHFRSVQCALCRGRPASTQPPCRLGGAL